ncbi:YhjD/YihY/BrkB family envelope integrity protein [Longispora sp. NPDC051575]|uniref:YhjD/YihY/BrkB family envelope integrity protein n=1 Tax=Longispora sp. NPDC051575 TaxID=3154943 RepID=UPI0034194F55
MGRLLARLDGYQLRHPWLGLPVAVVHRFTGDQAGNLAALIAYYAFFSFFPLMLVLVTLLGFSPTLRERAVGSVLEQFPVIGPQLGGNVQGLRGSTLALVIGIGTAVWAGLAVANAAQTAMNTLWRVPVADRPGLVPRTVRSLLLLAVLGTTVLATIVVNGLSAALDSLGPGARLLAILGTLAVNIGTFVLAFRALTDRKLSTRDVLPGAVLAGTCWQVLQLVGGLYVAHTVRGAGNTYGTFAIVIGLLGWFFLQAQVTLLAAELNAVLVLGEWPRSLLGEPGGEPGGAGRDDGTAVVAADGALRDGDVAGRTGDSRVTAAAGDGGTVGPGRAWAVDPGRARAVDPERAGAIGSGQAEEVGPGRAEEVGSGRGRTVGVLAAGKVLGSASGNGPDGVSVTEKEEPTMSTDDHRSTAQLVGDLGAQMSRLVRDEIALAKLETVARARQLGTGVGLLAGGALLALYGLGFLLAAAALGLATVLPTWLAVLLVGVLLAVLAGVAVLLGTRRVRDGAPPVPTDTLASVQRDVATIKESAHR